jgi:hypothetical protein
LNSLLVLVKVECEEPKEDATPLGNHNVLVQHAARALGWSVPALVGWSFNVVNRGLSDNTMCLCNVPHVEHPGLVSGRLPSEQAADLGT